MEITTRNLLTVVHGTGLRRLVHARFFGCVGISSPAEGPFAEDRFRTP